MRFIQFSPGYVQYLLKPQDWRRFNLLEEQGRWDQFILQTVNQLNATEFRISPPIAIPTDGKIIYRAPNLIDTLVYRHISNELKRNYRIKLPNRERISKQIVVLLDSDTPISVVRTDLQNFYSNVKFQKVIDRLRSEGELGSRELQVLDDLKRLTGDHGLPWGICVSSILSEITMLGVDRACRSVAGVYFYARYVDDIIMFGSVGPSQMLRQVKKSLKATGHNLITSTLKTSLLGNSPLTSELEDIKFDFLGYSYLRRPRQNGKADVTIRISANKVNRIKRKVRLSIEQFSIDRNVKDLQDRLRILTGNYDIKKKRHSSPIRAGIRNHYGLITKLEELERLDNYLKDRLLRCMHELI